MGQQKDYTQVYALSILKNARGEACARGDILPTQASSAFPDYSYRTHVPAIRLSARVTRELSLAFERNGGTRTFTVVAARRNGGRNVASLYLKEKRIHDRYADHAGPNDRHFVAAVPHWL